MKAINLSVLVGLLLGLSNMSWGQAFSKGDVTM